MNRLENIISTIVMMFILIIIFAAVYSPLGLMFGMIKDNVNATGGNYTLIAGQINKIPGYFGFIMICFAIAILVSFVLNAHKREHEEYEV